MRSLEVKQGRVVGWNHCNGYNDILTFHCNYCNAPRPNEFFNFYVLEIFDRGLVVSRERKKMGITQTEVDEFTKFFNAGCASAVETATIEELDAKIQELEHICLQGKATLQGMQKIRRERVDKLSKSERDKLVTNGSLDVANSDSLVRKRAERISRADKLKSNLAGLGLDDDMLKDLMSNVKVNENAQAAANDVAKSQFTFNKTTEAPVHTDKGIHVALEEMKQEKEKKEEPDFLKGLF